MARGEPAASFESLRPYFQGARFALIAIRRLHGDKPEVRGDLTWYIEMCKEYVAAVEETHRLRRARKRV